jgi:hypothetical protein
MSRGQPIKLTTHLIFNVPDFFFVVAINFRPSAGLLLKDETGSR